MNWTDVNDSLPPTGEDYVELKASDLAQMNSIAISKYIDRLEQMYYDKKTVAMYYYNQAYNDERSQEEDEI